MGKIIEGYAQKTTPSSADVIPIIDREDTSMSASGTNKWATIAAIAAAGGGGGSGPGYITYVAPSGSDDTAAINAVISQAGGAVQLAQGTYKISAPLTPASGSALLGVQGGWSSPMDAYGAAGNTPGVPSGTVIQTLSSFAGEAAILMDNESSTALSIGPLLRDLYIDCRQMPAQTGKLGNGSTMDGNGVTVWGSWAAGQMERITVLSPSGSGYVFDGGYSSGAGWPDNWVIRSCKASGARGLGGTVANGYASSAGGFGFCCIHAPDFVFSDCEASETGGDCWFLIDVANGQFCNCKGENSLGGNGWHMGGMYSGVYYANFAGCTSNWNWQNGWLFDNASGSSGVADYCLTGCKATNDNQGAAPVASGGGGLSTTYAGFAASGSKDRIMLTGCFTDGTAANKTPYYGASMTSSFVMQLTGGRYAGSQAATYDAGNNTHALSTSGLAPA